MEENRHRGLADREFELGDTGVFDGERYFDVVVEYAKAAPGDIVIRITVTNRGPDAAAVHLFPTLWFRNQWTWGAAHDGVETKPSLRVVAPGRVVATHPDLGEYEFSYEASGAAPLFTENETNQQRLYGQSNAGPFVKDGFHATVIGGDEGATNAETGTKFSPHVRMELGAGGSCDHWYRLTEKSIAAAGGPADLAEVLRVRREEADAFYASMAPRDEAAATVARQGYSGMVWSKQFYLHPNGQIPA